MTVNLFAALAAAASLAACGGSAADDSRSEFQRDREKLETRYNRLRGTYAGTIDPGEGGGQIEKVEIAMYVDYRDGGVDPEGNPRFLPLLLARFHLPDFVGENDRESLKADYDEITGRIIFTRAAAGGPAGEGGAAASGASAFSIRGTFRGDAIEGEVVRNGGTWGRLDVKRVSDAASSPAGGEDEAERRRRAKIFESIQGVYRGKVESSGIDFAGQLTITLTQRPGVGPSGKTIQLPVLTARFARLDAGDPMMLSWYMSDVSYNAQTRFITMATNAADAGRAGSAVSGAGVFAGEGRVAAGKADLRLTDHRGAVGRFRGTRVSR